MADFRIETEGLEELHNRFREYPRQYTRAVVKAMGAALLVIWENIPGYPREPKGSTYTRTGTLGKTLGVSMSGQRLGSKPDIYQVRGASGYVQGEFGTALKYAPYVIGDSETQQAWIHRARWWTIPQTVLSKAKSKIERVFEIMVEELAKWLDHRQGG